METESSEFDEELDNTHSDRKKGLSCPVLFSFTSSTLLEVDGMWGLSEIGRSQPAFVCVNCLECYEGAHVRRSYFRRGKSHSSKILSARPLGSTLCADRPILVP